MKKINLNSFATVKLTEHGKRLYKEYIFNTKKMLRDNMINSGLDPVDVEEYIEVHLNPGFKRPERDGTIKMQLWELFNIFGPVLSMGAQNVPFEDFIIKIDDKDIKDV